MSDVVRSKYEGCNMSDEQNIKGYFQEAQVQILKRPCGAAAPLVVNGAPFVGCSKEQGHDGQHSITISWGEEERGVVKRESSYGEHGAERPTASSLNSL